MNDATAISTEPEKAAEPSWRQYFTLRAAGIFLLNVASGAPLTLTLATLSLWLAREEVSKASIGLFALAGLPYSLKFLWSPLFDALEAPFFRRLGKRRGWMVLTQILLSAAIVWLGASDPAHHLMRTAVATLAVAFLSATQDILIDAYRIEILPEHEQATGAAMSQFGYRTGNLIAGALALVIAQRIGFPLTYAIMAALPLLGGLTVILWAEPVHRGLKETSGFFRRAVLAPLQQFLTRRAAVQILLFIMIFKIGDAMANLMLSPLQKELGFTNDEIAFANKIVGFGGFFFGAWIGSQIYAKVGTFRALLVTGLAMPFSNLGYLWLSLSGHDVGVLTSSVLIESIAAGAGGTVVVAYLSRLCDARFTATHYALLSAIAVVGRTTISGSSGYLAEAIGWPLYFIACAAMAIPGLLILLWLGKERLGVED